MLVKILFLLFPPVLFAANTCVDAQTGVWSATTTWSSCGSTIPQVGDTVNINSFKVTLDTNTSVTNIIVAAGQLLVDGLAPHTITCSATGIDCIQCNQTSGLNSNTPCDFSAGSATNFLTVTASGLNSNSLGAIAHHFATPFNTPNVNLAFFFVSNAGSGAGVYMSGGTTTVQINNCKISNAALGVVAGPTTLTVDKCYFTGITSSPTINPDFSTTATITNNTEVAASNGYMIRQISNQQSGFTFSGNALVTDIGGTVDRGIYSGGQPNTGILPTTIQYNIGKNYSTSTTVGVGACFGIIASHCTYQFNVMEDFYNGYFFKPYTDSSFNVGISNSADQPGQGIYIDFGYSNVLSNNDMGSLDTNGGNLGWFFLGATTAADTVTGNNLTLVGKFPDTGNSVGVGLGEGGAAVNLNVSTATLSNSIVSTFTNGISSGNSNNTFVSSGTGGVGVFNNDVFNVSGTVYFPNGTNFGTSPAHPSATYGDLSNVDPQLVNPYIRLADCDKVFGGPGTVADLFTQLSNRWNNTVDSRFTVQNIYICMSRGYSPQNLAIAKASSTLSFIGALPMIKLIGLGPQ